MVLSGLGPFGLAPEPKPLAAIQSSFRLVTWTSAGYAAVGTLPIISPDGSANADSSSAAASATNSRRPFGDTASATGDSPPPCGRSTDRTFATVMLAVSMTVTWSSLAIAT